MSTEQFLTLSHWLSPAYPVGGFAWSHGLESAIHDGIVAAPDALCDWLDDLLAHGAGRTDAILIHAAHTARGAELADLAALATALQPTRERRAESLAQGDAFAAITRALRGLDLPDGLPYPVALGHAAGLEGLPPEPVAQLYLQAVVTNLVQAAQRLMPLGQTAAHRIVAGLATQCATVAAAAATLGPDDIGSAGLAIDIASMRHETLEPRLFRS
ncbi:MAG: urease accessory protein UreF [Rubellimicrobium sp.]|nr:urease accessory protein UreF [Rubellimicrobium sp.]